MIDVHFEYRPSNQHILCTKPGPWVQSLAILWASRNEICIASLSQSIQSIQCVDYVDNSTAYCASGTVLRMYVQMQLR